MNVWTFTGNLGRDAELRHTQTGLQVTNFSVAVRSGYGEREQTTWVKCALFGKRAEALTPYLKTGQSVAVSGEATLRKWQGQDGQDRFSLEVRVSEIDLQGSRDTAGGSAGQQANGRQAGAQEPQQR
ncbi:MAG: single-stranded DNA-binding protein, partial [Wenzhouxiangella sp.]|nr:single-stranded DNA-binding protein [Wenzhouxiangella sp.]